MKEPSLKTSSKKKASLKVLPPVSSSGKHEADWLEDHLMVLVLLVTVNLHLTMEKIQSAQEQNQKTNKKLNVFKTEIVFMWLKISNFRASLP